MLLRRDAEPRDEPRASASSTLKDRIVCTEARIKAGISVVILIVATGKQTYVLFNLAALMIAFKRDFSCSNQKITWKLVQ